MEVRSLQMCDEKTVAKQLSVSPQLLRKWRALGRGPAWAKLAGSRVAYPADAVEQFIRDCMVERKAA